MSDIESDCPECSGAGFFGNNGPMVESICNYCGGTGVLINGNRYKWTFDTPRKPVSREMGKKIMQRFWELNQRENMG